VGGGDLVPAWEKGRGEWSEPERAAQ
jgi:hypothetical protein